MTVNHPDVKVAGTASQRETEIAAFLAAHGWDKARRRRIAGDASFRKYDRLQDTRGTVVLMDAPPPHEDVRPWMSIARHLHGLGFSAPGIIAADARAGLLLIEDLGDDTYTRLLARGANEEELYTLAIDALIGLHKLPMAVPPGVIPYGTPRLLEEVNRLHMWYLPLVGAPPLNDAARAEYEAIWQELLPLAWKAPTSLVLFDYHVDNLLGLFDRPGIKACGLLDFQDAVAGPVTYDLMSLLEDARRDIDPALVASMKQRYLAAFPEIDVADFNLSWAVMAAQRHTRVLGTFARLKVRDNKPHYLVHIPRLWRYMDRCLVHPRLAPLKAWFDTHVPAAARAVAP
jgi:aminoglycoside/choline kinase family phosphotransferase